MKRRFIWEALASFFVVGLGQILKGEGKKGLNLILVFYFALPSAIYLSLMLNAQLFLLVMGISLISGIIIWGFNVWDACLPAGRH